MKDLLSSAINLDSFNNYFDYTKKSLLNASDNLVGLVNYLMIVTCLKNSSYISNLKDKKELFINCK